MTCLEARAPPPLPPRAILSKQSSLLTSPTVLLPQRSLPVAASLPPLPARGDNLCLKTPSWEEVAAEYFFPPGRCLSQQQQQPPPPSIGSPPASARRKAGDSMTRRPLPPEPANPSVGADQSRQVYTQVTRKTETATRRSPGASRKAHGVGESVATMGEPKPSPPPPPVRYLPGETTTAARGEFSETASSAVPPESPAGKTAAPAPSKLKSSESFGAWEVRQAQRNPDARGGAQVRRIQTTPRLNLEEGEAKKSRIQLQAQLVEDCLRRSLTKGEATACDDAGKVRIRPALPALTTAIAQEEPTTCTLRMKYEDPLSPGTPAQPGHELRPAYAPAKSSSGEGLQKPDVIADRSRDPGAVRAEQGPVKGAEKVMASSFDCNRGLRTPLMSELRSNQLGPEGVGYFQKPVNTEHGQRTHSAITDRQNPPTSDNVVETTRATMEDCDTVLADTAAAARCLEEPWWSEELGAKPDTPQMFRSEAAARSFKKNGKDEGKSMLRIEQQLKSLFSEDSGASFSTPPTARDSGKPLTVPQTGDAKPEVAVAMATCDRKQSYDVARCRDTCRRIPIPRLPTCSRLPPSEENTDAVRAAARSGQSAQSSCQLTTEQLFASGISQERRDIGSDQKSERKTSKCTTRSPQMSPSRPSREADD